MDEPPTCLQIFRYTYKNTHEIKIHIKNLIVILNFKILNVNVIHVIIIQMPPHAIRPELGISSHTGPFVTDHDYIRTRQNIGENSNK